jgi:hypothetical protein
MLDPKIAAMVWQSLFFGKAARRPAGREFAQCNQILIPRCEAETATKLPLSADISQWFAVPFLRRSAKTEDFRG